MSSNQEITELKELLNKALQRLYENDMSLIERRANERAITFRFGIYFEELVKNSSFKELNVDAEYNRNGEGTKSTDSKPHGTHPDILLHERETNNKNKLVLEFKGRWNKDKCGACDKKKLMEFTSKNQGYRYVLGAWVLLEQDKPVVKYFLEGREESLQKGAGL
jgi:hypothetical protein